MENFVAFLRDNWKFLVEISIPLVSLIVLCFVKKTKVTIGANPINTLLINLPDWIVEAEEKFGAGNGSEKFRFVFNRAIAFIVSETGLSTGDVLRSFGDQIILNIESILEAPHKKGDQK